jgi:hypothetical protein
MAYIGREPQIGNFQVCDDITVVNGQAAYTMQVNSVNVSPETANHCLVSLNGVLQKSSGTSPSFTISGSTITFASNLVTGDVINFIHILGSVLDLGVPSDDTVTAAKLGANSVTAAKLNNDIISGSTELASEPADTDEFLVSDAGTIKRIDYSLIKGGGSHVLLSTTNVTSGVAQVDFTSGIDSTYKDYMITFTGVHPATAGQKLGMRISHSGTFKTDNNYMFAIGGTRSTGDSFHDGDASGTDRWVIVQNIGNGGDQCANGRIILCNPSGTSFGKQFYSDSISQSNASEARREHAGGFYNSGNAIDGVRFLMSSGNIDLGTFKLYGIN